MAAGHTIGVSIVIPEPFRTQIDLSRRRYGQTIDMDAHITVLPPIDVDGDALPAVTEHLREIADATAPFRLILRGTGTFRPVSPVVFITVAAGIASCEMLEERVRSGVMAVDNRFPYHPHLTIAHDVSDDVLDQAFSELSDFDASMDIGSMCLHELVGDEWVLLQEFVFSRLE